MSPEFPILSIDVEDWLISSLDHRLPVNRYTAENTLRLLHRLDRLETRATMFVLGKFAEKFPDIVRRIGEAGHEVASHGYEHIEITMQTRRDFTEDVVRSKDLLEQITGKPVLGYRAPVFSIVSGTLWALEVLAETGFVYDSSIFPVSHPRYGIRDWSLFPTTVELKSVRIIEFPIAVSCWNGFHFPVGGGGYMRVLPVSFLIPVARSILRNRLFVFYCHPYEFDSREFDRIQVDIPLKMRLRYGFGRSQFGKRFDRLVSSFRFIRFVDVLNRKNFQHLKLDHSRERACLPQAGDDGK